MGFETPEPVVYPPLRPLVVEDPWAWYRNTDGDEDDDVNEIDEDSEWRLHFFLLFLVLDAKGGEKDISIYLAILLFSRIVI
jgi:hypothetical protein